MTEEIVGEEFEHGAVAFFDLQPGLRLALWPRRSIAHDSGLEVTGSRPTEFTPGHNFASRAEVDQLMAQAKSAGAKIVKPAQDKMPLGAGMQATSRILTGICGRWFGIRSSPSRIEAWQGVSADVMRTFSAEP